MVYRRNGLNPVTQLRDEMDRLVGDFFAPLAGGPVSRSSISAQGYPALNVWEENDVIYVEAEVPGLKSEDLDISVVGNEVAVRGKRTEGAPSGAVYHRQERGVGEFNRLLRLPVELDPSRVEASLKDGILLIKLPKAESAKPKKIKVEPGK